MFSDFLKNRLENGAKVIFSRGSSGQVIFFPRFSNMDSKTVQRSPLCRSRRAPSHAYFVAKFGFDTADNEPSEVPHPG